MKKYLFKWSLMVCLCLAAIPVIAQTTDSGDYGFHLQFSKDKFTYIQTGIYFYLHASDKYVGSEDAAEVDGPFAQVYLSSYSSDNRNLCINTLSDYVNGKRIRLYVAATSSGLYSISLADVFGMDTAGYSIYLVDQQKKDSVDIVNHPNYAFYISLKDARSFGGNRFLVAIEHKPHARYKSFYLSPFAAPHIQYQTLNAALWTNDISTHETTKSTIIHLQKLK